MNREKIRSKTAALRAKTKAAGCTEAEALAAAELAAKLMQSHGLSEAEIKFVAARARASMTMPLWQRRLLKSICRCTNTASIMQVGDICEIEFLGEEHAVEIAIYLRDVLTRAVNAEIRKLRGTTTYRRLRKVSSKSTMAHSFAAGMIVRIERKLDTLFQSSVCSAERALAEQYRDEKHPDSTVRKSRPLRAVNGHAYFAGAKAGDALQLSHGVSGMIATALIGGRQ